MSAVSEAQLRAEFERQHAGRNLKQHCLRGTYVASQIAALWNQHRRTAAWMESRAALSRADRVPASGQWVDDWNRLASPAVQEAFVRDCCAGMSKPTEWGQQTMDFMTFALKMYQAGWAAAQQATTTERP